MSNKKTRRQNEIINLLRSTPTMRVNELGSLLSVTSETIRRDLDELHDKGLLERTYGGAILHMSQKPGLNVRHNLLIKEREAIAKEVVKEIKDARHLMISSGATNAHIARRIAMEMNDITVIVHSFGVALELSINPSIKILMAPGLYNATESANHGTHTIKFLESFWVDYAIIGASGLTKEGICDTLIEAGEVYAKMISRAYRTILAADRSKFNLKFPAHFANWCDISMLVTDQTPPDELAFILHKNNISIRTALPDESIKDSQDITL